MKKTKIVCTMGPNSNDENIMRQLVKEGMDIARFNFSHGSHEEQKGRMDMLKKIREEEKKPVAILLDTKGPEIRTGVLKDGKKVLLKEGETITLTNEEIEGDETKVSLTYKGLVDDVQIGNNRSSCPIQHAFFNSPPTASTCPCHAFESIYGSGAYPRLLRIIYGSSR